MLILISGRLHRRLAGPRTGLTLVELLTVIAVISILISILIPTVRPPSKCTGGSPVC